MLAGQLGIMQALQVTTDYPDSIYVIPAERLSEMGGYSPITGDSPAMWLSKLIPEPVGAG
jgi:hypothetical protein